MAKILKKLVLRRLEKFVELENILSDNQFGFRKGRSCDIVWLTLI